ncbi:putative reverse transcriptase domain-containing protein [Tanacetum coccineum]
MRRPVPPMLSRLRIKARNGGNGNGGNGNGGNGNPNENGRGDTLVARECTYQDFMKCKPLNFKGMEGVVGLIRWFEKMETVFHISNCPEKYQGEKEEDQVEKFIGGLPDNIQRNVIVAEPTRLQDVVRIANNLMYQKLKGYAMKNVENKRRLEVNVARAYTAGNNERKPYNGLFPLCNKCKLHHEGPCTMRCGKCNKIGHLTRDCKRTLQDDCLTVERSKPWKTRLETRNGFGEARGNSICTGGTERSFVSTSFSTLLDITLDTLDFSYVVELADGRISETNTIVIGCMLGLLGHPFNINLMPVELGSFDVIIGMDWLANHHVVIVCDEKIVRIPYGDEVLIVEAQVTKKGTEDKLEEKRLEDVPTVRDFLEEDHAEHLKLIFELLKKEELYAKFSKCEFWLSKIQFLGHMIDSEGIHVDPTKIESIKDWASPKTLIEIRQFLGLAGYYRRFIKGFSKISKPMTKLTQKNVKFDWSEKAEAAFQLLKQKLCSAPILSLPEGSEIFVVYCGASCKEWAQFWIAKEKILEAQVEARKEENYGIEDLCGMIKKLEPRADGT